MGSLPRRSINRERDTYRIETWISFKVSWHELGVQIDHVNLTEPGSYFQQSSAGGLGWGLGAALGAKLAAPDRFVIAAVGDGSYMFGNPTPVDRTREEARLKTPFALASFG